MDIAPTHEGSPKFTLVLQGVDLRAAAAVQLHARAAALRGDGAHVPHHVCQRHVLQDGAGHLQDARPWLLLSHHLPDLGKLWFVLVRIRQLRSTRTTMEPWDEGDGFE